jgi:hypothetical protein
MMGISIAGLCRTASGEETRQSSTGKPIAINIDDYRAKIFHDHSAISVFPNDAEKNL